MDMNRTLRTIEREKVLITTKEYRELIACRVGLDMIIASVGEYGASREVVKAASDMRGTLSVAKPNIQNSDGTDDAE